MPVDYAKPDCYNVTQPHKGTGPPLNINDTRNVRSAMSVLQSAFKSPSSAQTGNGPLLNMKATVYVRSAISKEANILTYMTHPHLLNNCFI